MTVRRVIVILVVLLGGLVAWGAHYGVSLVFAGADVSPWPAALGATVLYEAVVALFVSLQLALGPVVWAERCVWALALVLGFGVVGVQYYWEPRSGVLDEEIRTTRSTVAEIDKEYREAALKGGTNWGNIAYTGERAAQAGSAGKAGAAGPGATGGPGAQGSAAGNGAGDESDPNWRRAQALSLPPIYEQYKDRITDVIRVSKELKIKYSNKNEVAHLSMQAAGYHVELDNGKVGYLLQEVDDGSILSTKLEFRPGDVILSINGEAVPQSVEEGWALYDRFKDANINEAAVEILRDGQVKVIYYPIQ